MRRDLSNGSLASWFRAVCFGFVLLGLSSGAAHAQVITEFSTGITSGAAPNTITTGPDGNLWFTETGSARTRNITPAAVATASTTPLPPAPHPPPTPPPPPS